MAMTISNVLAGIAVSTIAGQANDGSLEIHASTQPTNVEASAHGTVIAPVSLGAVVFANPTDAAPGAVVSANGITAVSATTSGDVQGNYFRVFSSAGTAIIDGTISSAGGSGEMTLNSVVIDQDQLITINTWTITMPES